MENTRNSSRKQDLKDLSKEYKIMDSIGSGSFGEVFKVKHRVSKKVFAAKYIKDFMKFETLANAVYNECCILRELS
jgi:serine/threonine protein kinase